MKTTLLSFLLCLSALAVADDSFPPKGVKAAIKEHCEGTVNSIEKERIKGFAIFVVNCSEDEQEIEYFFSESGRLIHVEEEYNEEEHDDEEEHDEEEHETFTVLEHDELPENIKNAIKENVDGKHLEYGREVAYYVEAREEDQIIIYVFNEHGELIEREEHDDEEEHDEEEHDEEE